MRPVFIAISLIQLVLLGVIVVYLYQLQRENCACALVPPYRFLQTTVWILLFVRCYLLIQEFNVSPMPNLVRGVLAVSVLVSLVFYGVSLYFLTNLYRLPCDCSKNMLMLVYGLYSVFKVLWIVMGAALLFYTWFLWKK